MYSRFWNFRRTIIWLILILQLLLITTYFYAQINSVDDPRRSGGASRRFEIKFLSRKQNESFVSAKRIFRIAGETIVLPDLPSDGLYADLNSSLCYRNGTDVERMKRTKSVWKCSCLNGWHGSDCSQPEAIWRALIAHKHTAKRINEQKRKNQRRVVYLFNVDEYSEPLADIRINELNASVDLFVLCDSSNGLYEKVLLKGSLRLFQPKILLIPTANGQNRLQTCWETARSAVSNLQTDDVLLISKDNELPLKSVIRFLKLHDDWPEPIRFRLRWVVYGFFWLHPERTVLKTGACTVGFLRSTLSDNVELLLEAKANALVVGDLNHYGGWYCDFCVESSKMVGYLTDNRPFVDWNRVAPNGGSDSNRIIIDSEYIEDLIQNGIHLNGKTNLLRVHRSQETYYAPKYVQDNAWLYDWLLVNMYNVLDY